MLATDLATRKATMACLWSGVSVQLSMVTRFFSLLNIFPNRVFLFFGIFKCFCIPSQWNGAKVYNPNSLSQMILSPASYVISLMTCLMLLLHSTTDKTSAQ